MTAPLLLRRLALAFFLSGCSGLIFQTVWVRMLTRYLGATTPATATVLGVFMGGLAVGSWAAGKLADRLLRPLHVYAYLEMLVGVLGVGASLVIVYGVGPFYVEYHGWVGDHPALLLAGRVVFVALALFLPTFLMGMTLPIVVAFITDRGAALQAGLGWLYSVNTFGAVVGVLATGLVLLGELGETVSLAVAAVLNFAAAAVAWRIAIHRDPPIPDLPPPPPPPDWRTYAPGLRRLVLGIMFVSGLTALAYEVLWSRLLVLILETSIYAFSTMLGTFLVGIAVGSAVAARSPRLRQYPLVAVGLIEVFLGLWAAVGLLALPVFNLAWMHVQGFDPPMPVASFGVGALGCVFVVLPMAVAFGMQFPVAARCVARAADEPGAATGRLYWINTLGTIVGSLAAGFVLIPLLGTAWAMLLLATLNVGLGLILILRLPTEEQPAGTSRWAWVGAGAFLVAAVFVGDPYLRMMADRVGATFGDEGCIFAAYESSTATTVAAGIPNVPTARALYVNGVGMSHLCTETKIMAHLPHLLTEAPKRMLVICFGMGTTLRSASRYGDLHVEAVDIVPEVFKCFPHFHADAQAVSRQHNVKFFVDDGRNFLLTHPQPYDIITIDPAPPLHSAGSVNLYTQEFFALCLSRLKPGGLFCLWIPTAPASETKMIMRSFLGVFPDATLWGSLEYPGFYLIGGKRSITITPERMADLARRLSKIRDLSEWGPVYTDPERLKALYLSDTLGLWRLVGDAVPVTDDHPYTEFPLWRLWWHGQDNKSLTPDRVRKERLTEPLK